MFKVYYKTVATGKWFLWTVCDKDNVNAAVRTLKAQNAEVVQVTEEISTVVFHWERDNGVLIKP